MFKKLFASLTILALLLSGVSEARAKKKVTTLPEIKASWIGIQDCDHPIYFKSLFLCFKDVKSATAVISAKGGCQVQINQKTVGDRYLTPGEKPGEQYQVFDITRLLRKGANSVHAIVTPFSAGTEASQDRMLLMQVNITYKNGKQEVFCSDKDWLVSETGPVILADATRGESINHNIECQWTPVNYITKCNASRLFASDAGTLRHSAPICGVDYIETPMNEKVIDFGQVICGWDKVVLRGAKGHEIRIRHSTSLDSRGNFPLGEEAMSAFTPSKDVDEFESTHTLYKFRYICVEGVDGPLFLKDYMAIPAIAEGSDEKTTFLFSDTGLNYHNFDNIDLSAAFDAVSVWEQYMENGDLSSLRKKYNDIKYRFQSIDPVILTQGQDGPLAVAHYAACAKSLANVASELGMADDTKNWENYFNSSKELFLNEFVTPSGRIVSYDPLSYASALKWDIIPSERQNSVLVNMLAQIPQQYRLPDKDADVICSVLSDNGYNPLAYTLARSNNTSIDKWLKGYVLGIRPTSPGYKTFDIQPHIENEAKHSVQGGIETKYGRIQVCWEAMDGRINKISVSVPSGTSARLLYNGQVRVLKSGTTNVF